MTREYSLQGNFRCKKREVLPFNRKENKRKNEISKRLLRREMPKCLCCGDATCHRQNGQYTQNYIVKSNLMVEHHKA